MMSSWLPPPPLYLEVDTFVDLGARGDAVADWVRFAHDTLFAPLHVEEPVARSNGAGASEWGPPRAWWSGITTESLRDGSTAVLPYGPSTLADADARLRGGDLRRLTIAVKVLDEQGYPANHLGGFHVGVDFAGAEFDGAASAVHAAASSKLLGERISSTAAAAWTAAAVEAARILDAATGYVTVDYAGPSESPYELRIGRYWLDGRREADRLLRGYFWRTFLSAGHIARLGGADALRGDRWTVEEVVPGGSILFVRLDGAPDDVPDETLRALRDMLEPVLPPPDPSYEYDGPLPLRTIEG